MYNILTVDVEDWYQSSTELFCKRDSYKTVYPGKRVIKNTHKLLELLSENQTKATFFILGTVAERFPELITEIKDNGHEIAIHGYYHHLVYEQSREQFTQDLHKSISLTQDITGERVMGYRAPYFSITEKSRWALNIMLENGLDYDSSIFPINRRLYGIPNSPRYPYLIASNGGRILLEFPISTLRFAGFRIPTGGGGYLRILPYSIIKASIKQANRYQHPTVIYIHPYELDCNGEKLPYYIRSLKDHMVKVSQEFNRKSVEKKIKQLIKEFKFTSISSYLC
jgi:polysaccharide deacetylase family protein (PEP-CTERM system associated)